MLLETIVPADPVGGDPADRRHARGARAARPPGVIVAGTAGAMIGNHLLVSGSRARSASSGCSRFIDRYGRWLTMDWHDVEKAQRLFDRHGAGIVFVGRMLPTVRTFISIPAGLAQHAARRFLLWSTLGTAGLERAARRRRLSRSAPDFATIDEVVGPARPRRSVVG